MNVIKIIKEHIDVKNAMKIYGEYYEKHRETFVGIVTFFEEKQEKMSIWGGGLKGNAFLRTFDPSHKHISFVYDIDKKKQGKTLSTGHNVVDYQDKSYQDIQVVFIMNCNHENEIAGKLLKEEMHVKLINVDSIIYGNLNTDEALRMYGGVI